MTELRIGKYGNIGRILAINGIWEYDKKSELYLCSNCKYGATEEDLETYLYCPNCGAQMVKERIKTDDEAIDPSDLMSHEEAWNTIKGDLIGRTDAIKALSRSSVYAWSTEQDLVAHSWAIRILQSLPSADAKQGEWIEKYNGNGWNDFWDYTCSNCGKKYERADAVLYHANYCPNCGARMKGGAK